MVHRHGGQALIMLVAVMHAKKRIEVGCDALLPSDEVPMTLHISGVGDVTS